MKKALIISLLVLVAQYSFGQQFTDLYGDYLGQTPPSDTPVVFARGIVSTDNLEHSAPAFSPDRNEVFWYLNRPSGNGGWLPSLMMTMKRVGDRWTVPAIVPYFGAPVFSTNGKRLYFDLSKPSTNGKGNGPWFIEKQNNKWSEPKCVGLVALFPELQFVGNLSITGNGTLYFIAYAAGQYNNSSIYRSEFKNGEYLKPQLLPNSINLTPFLNWTPYISPDESYLLFSSNRSGSLDEYGDLYVCFRKSNGSWTDAISLGETINSNQQERFPAVSPDGKYLFFSRYNGDTSQDVFWVSAKIIDRLREKNNIKK